MRNKDEGELRGGEASETGEDVLTRDEYAELARLVDADLNGGDVEYLAFSSLCPTMCEGEFDERVCRIFERLRDAGMIEGESDGAGFYFTGLTSRGREFVFRREESEEGVFGAEWAQLASVPADSDGNSTVRAVDAGDEGSVFFLKGKKQVILLVALCAAVGFVAGIAGGVLGAYLLAS